jgi:hypothetical protein
MLKHFTVLALSLTLTPVVAMAETSAPRTIEHRGNRYTYTTTEKDGVRIVRGTAGKGFAPFELVVGKRRVTGTVDGRPVSFLLSSVKPLKGTVEVAAR